MFGKINFSYNKNTQSLQNTPKTPTNQQQNHGQQSNTNKQEQQSNKIHHSNNNTQPTQNNQNNQPTQNNHNKLSNPSFSHLNKKNITKNNHLSQ